MKILVTGYAGMNGSWTCRELVGRGHDVVGVDMRTGTTPWEAELSGEQFEARKLDIADHAAVVATVEDVRPDVIVHSAAVTATEDQPMTGFRVNCAGSVNLLEAARLAGTRRFVFSSSKAVYGEAGGPHGHPDYVPIDETHPRSPMRQLRLYGATKYLVEEFGQRYTELFGLEFVALRFATIYGPGKTGPVGVFTRLVEGALRGEPVRIESGGDQLDEFVYVKDVANGVADACAAAAPVGGAYNIGSGELSSLHDVVSVLRPHLDPVPEIEIGAGLNYIGIEGLYSRLDSTRAERELGYTPRYCLETGIADYVRTIREGGRG